ncbi:hypothetical protein BJV78DRAFT_1309690 [Lactifluus subvellereus]|nr:hypothetical protein BJV78DRAFT_1309690 [Lactifluus subvellereus]
MQHESFFTVLYVYLPAPMKHDPDIAGVLLLRPRELHGCTPGYPDHYPLPAPVPRYPKFKDGANGPSYLGNASLTVLVVDRPKFEERWVKDRTTSCWVPVRVEVARGPWTPSIEAYPHLQASSLKNEIEIPELLDRGTMLSKMVGASVCDNGGDWTDVMRGRKRMSEDTSSSKSQPDEEGDEHRMMFAIRPKGASHHSCHPSLTRSNSQGSGDFDTEGIPERIKLIHREYASGKNVAIARRL